MTLSTRGKLLNNTYINLHRQTSQAVPSAKSVIRVLKTSVLMQVFYLWFKA